MLHDRRRDDDDNDSDNNDDGAWSLFQRVVLGPVVPRRGGHNWTAFPLDRGGAAECALYALHKRPWHLARELPQYVPRVAVHVLSPPSWE